MNIERTTYEITPRELRIMISKELKLPVEEIDLSVLVEPETEGESFLKLFVVHKPFTENGPGRT